MAPTKAIQKEAKAVALVTESYIVLFKIEGHTTWRVSQYPVKEAFDSYLKAQLSHPSVTDRVWYKVDKIKGKITLEK